MWNILQRFGVFQVREQCWTSASGLTDQAAGDQTPSILMGQPAWGVHHLSTPLPPSGFWLVLLAVLLAILTLGMLPSRSSIETHTAGWASALALAQLAEVPIAAAV